MLYCEWLEYSLYTIYCQGEIEKIQGEIQWVIQ